MILIGIGANLPHPDYGSPRATCGAVLNSFNTDVIPILLRSPWYRSAPVPHSDQPWYVNAVVQIETNIPAADLLKKILQIEQRFGRVRHAKNEARTVDLDLLDYHGCIVNDEDGLIVPHPRLQERAFVLYPLADIVPDWHHPILNRSVQELIERLPEAQTAESIPDGSGVFGTEWQT